MIDPLAEIVTLLQPQATFSKVVSGAGQWRVRRGCGTDPFYCVVLEGGSRLSPNGQAPIALEAGDFVLIPQVLSFEMTSLEPPAPSDTDSTPTELIGGGFRLGNTEIPAEVQLLIGHCVFGSPDAALLLSLLPELVHVRGDPRLGTLVKLVRDESLAQRPARDMVLARLLEVLLIEALRSTQTATAPGLVRGLTDARLTLAIREIHERPEKAWTVAQLAETAALSRSAFFERFSRAVGVAPMEYLLSWRMAVAKNLLRRKVGGIAQVAERVGYSSASAFSVAFARHVGVSPSQFLQGG